MSEAERMLREAWAKFRAADDALAARGPTDWFPLATRRAAAAVDLNTEVIRHFGELLAELDRLRSGEMTEAEAVEALR